MCGKTLWKIRLLLKAIKIMRNWYLYPAVYFKLTKKPKVIFETKNGIKLYIRTNPASSDIHIFSEIWLEKAYNLQDFKIQKNDIVIDMGAHIGIFSIYASQFCKNGKIYAYEASKENYDILMENLQINKIKNVFAFNKAGFSKTGTAKFYLSENDLANHSLYKKTKNSVDVETTTLSEIFTRNSLEKCDFLKMDCEGAEFDILMNLSDEYFEKIKKICLEYHHIDGSNFTVTNLNKKLQSHNFVVRIIPHSEKIGFLYASKGKND